MFAIGSITAAVSHIFPAAIPKPPEVRPNSPFPTIPDVSYNPDIINETVSEIRSRPVTPFLQVHKPEEEVEETVIKERPSSPFPGIPDVSEQEVTVQEDVEKYQQQRVIESSLRPSSPFPKIPDVSSNPEVIEKDITTIKTSPNPFPLETPNVEEPEKAQEISHYEEPVVKAEAPQEVKQSSTEQPPVPFPTIPQTDESQKSEGSFFQPPARKFEPVSLTGKVYKVKEPSYVPLEKKPEYNFALADTEYKSIERSYTDSTATKIRSLQSEIFESQGHFVASRSCSPFPVFIPASRESTPVPKPPPNQEVIVQKVESTAADPKIVNKLQESVIGGDKKTSEVIKSQQKCFSEFQEIKDCYAQADKELSEFTLSIQERKQSLKPVIIVDENEMQKRLKEMKAVREGIDVLHQNGIRVEELRRRSETDDFIKPVEVKEFNNNSVDETVMQCKQEEKYEDHVMISQESSKTEEIQESSVINHSSNLQSYQCSQAPSTQLQQNEAQNLKRTSQEPPETKTKQPAPTQRDTTMLFERPECRKPPDAVIGARPLFGQLNINEEFKKALVGRSKSVQNKRNMQQQQIREPNKVKVEQIEDVATHEIVENGQLQTQMRDKSVAEISTIKTNPNEEVEKIYYQQEREYEVDFQTMDGNMLPQQSQNIATYFGPQSFQYADSKEVQNNVQPKEPEINYLYRPRETYATSHTELNHSHQSMEASEEDMYSKVPVKSLIKCFEESAMPAMRYKKIRDPLPDIVEKLNNGSKHTQKEFVQKNGNESAFAKTTAYNSSSSSVTKQCDYSDEYRSKQDLFLKKAEEEFDNLYYVANSCIESREFYPKQEVQQFRQSENSSFCKYSSQSVQSSHSQLESTQSGFKPIAEDGLSTGKLFCSFIFL